jgi:hypothetical protein
MGIAICLRCTSIVEQRRPGPYSEWVIGFEVAPDDDTSPWYRRGVFQLTTYEAAMAGSFQVGETYKAELTKASRPRA